MFGHHGLIGENVPQGVGAALGSGRPILCLFGDGAGEEDYVFSAMGFAATHRLPVMFVCEDNNLSILTEVEKRRTWRLAEVVRALGMPAIEIADDPWTIAYHAQELRNCLPAFLNIHVCRMNWHVGAGSDGEPEWDRLNMVRETLGNLGLGAMATVLESKARREMEAIWVQ
jgi:pyruvate dehydrogenase E1 component alpha subunit